MGERARAGGVRGIGRARAGGRADPGAGRGVSGQVGKRPRGPAGGIGPGRKIVGRPGPAVGVPEIIHV